MEKAVDTKRALKLYKRDNVATVLSDTETGDRVEIQIPGGDEPFLVSKDHVPFGHKVAIKDIPADDPVLKYGASIGIATREISEGEHVHTHNLKSARVVKHD